MLKGRTAVDGQEPKRYPELYERFKTPGICLKNFKFYVFSSGEVVYTDDRHWYSIGSDGNWKVDYETERWAMDAGYGMGEVPDEVAEEYGFKPPERDDDAR